MTKEKLREIIFVNLGQASMCWSEWPTGVFNSEKAVELGEEIMKAIDEYIEEDKEPGWNNPLVDFLDWEEKYNRSLKELARQKEERRFKLDDSFKKAMEEAVVSDTPVSTWMDKHKGDYDKVLASGMFWEFHPTWTGEWEKDKFAFCHDRRYNEKLTGREEISPQDPAVYSKRDNTTVEDIHDIHREMLEIEETDEEAAYRKGYMDGYDEGLYDGQYK